jgi:hypothetical protein
MRQRRTYDGYVLMTRTEQSLLELHDAVNESREAAIDVGYTSPSDATPTGACQRGSGQPGLASPSGRAGAVAATREHGRSCRPCHPRAISSGHERYLADIHGHIERAVMLGTCR